MASSHPQVQWAPKIPQSKIRQLYITDAKGIFDEDLINDIAYGLYARCKSILTVTEASKGRVTCPQCGNIILRRIKGKGTREELLVCKQCSWKIVWGDYHKTYNKKQLHGGGALPIFKEYVAQFPKAKTPQEKMCLIDKLIHQFHSFYKNNQFVKYTRPVAANLIEGTMTEVIEFLDNLTYGTQTSMERKKNKEAWRAKLNHEGIEDTSV